MVDLQYRIFTLPKLQPAGSQDWSLKYLAEKYRKFRLHALKTSPEAFASTADSPTELDIQCTIQRLSNPKAVQYIAAEGEILKIAGSSPEGIRESLSHAEWLGLIVLLGPEESAVTGPPSAKTDPFAQMTVQPTDSVKTSTFVSPNVSQATKEPSLHYHLNGMFVTPTARSRGIGNALIQTALATGLAQARKQGCSTSFSIAVNEENRSAQALYEKVGFTYTGKETYTQETRIAHGIATIERVALHMEMVCI
ncbi:hypothetical protein K431DRAFT_283807 [Polychaeton citri CBS 116435]|uniref:N-acetyltransferase domain-containing protein n=1 Tax=Polychaeton citri CBS 116435 TaxID=1314669 RepID=A0A9P4UQB8_9PEZI|nr:hypothetical protein K431DRAFT_283807 [Polychaeton citri CBS 116435]